MPTYEYKCPDGCGIHDYTHSAKEEPKLICPLCDSIMKKMVSMPAGIHFKGTGFYATDYKGKQD